jgi:hypothetical protein
MVLVPPLDSFAQLVPGLTVHSLMHLVPHLRGDIIHARMKAFAGIMSPSRPRFPNENTGRPNPFIIRTPGLVELQGLLVSLCKRHNLCKSEAALVNVHGWH